MPVTTMNHFTILTDDVPRTVSFYDDLLGLEDGPRPPFGFPGAWLYAGGVPILHVIGGKTRADLRAGGIDYDLRRLVGRGQWQLFFFDPNGARVELDFAAEEAAPSE